MTIEATLPISGDSDDLSQVVKNLAEKCSAEEAEYRTTAKLLRRYKKVLVWLVIWLAMVCVVVACGDASPMLWAVMAYLIVLLAVAIYILVSLGAISKTAIEEPPIRQRALDETAGYRPEQVEDLFNYYWAIDKRNDRVSTTTSIAGSIIGISTFVLMVALIVLFFIGI